MPKASKGLTIAAIILFAIGCAVDVAFDLLAIRYVATVDQQLYAVITLAGVYFSMMLLSIAANLAIVGMILGGIGRKKYTEERGRRTCLFAMVASAAVLVFSMWSMVAQVLSVAGGMLK